MLVCIKYSELSAAVANSDGETVSSVLERIGKGFGSDDQCLGIIAITDITELEEKRNNLLPLARTISMLPADDLDEIEVPEASYQVGWSHGKEKLEGVGKFDLAKGSFYANPITDDFVSEYKEKCSKRKVTIGERSSSIDVEKMIQENASFFARNVWPSRPPELKPSLIEVSDIIRGIGIMLAKMCDKFVQSKLPSSASFTKMEDVLKDSLYCKARLLHYFPTGNQKEQKRQSTDSDFSSWCGWHNDMCCLTGLVPGMYLDKDGNQTLCPDPNAGLYIKSRGGEVIHVQIPSNCLAFQIGETSQIHTGGILQATPHAVKGCDPSLAHGISRESFAVFMQPEFHLDMNLPEGKSIQDAQNEEKAQLFLPKGVRTLSSRFEVGMNFGEFSEATFQAFH